MPKRARFPESLHGHQDPRPDQLQRTGYGKPKKKKKHELLAQLSQEIAACIVCDRPITQVVEELLVELGHPLDYEASDKLRDVRLYVAAPAPLRRQRPQLIAGTAAFIVAFFEIVRRRRTQPIPEMAFVAAVPFDSVQGERFNDDDWSEWAAGLEPAARRSIEATLAYAREHGDDPSSDPDEVVVVPIVHPRAG